MRLTTSVASVGFDAFFADEHERLFRALYFVTGDRHDAEELMQDAFLKLWERWDQVSRLDDPQAYLFRAALNGFRMRRRRAATALRKLSHTTQDRDPFRESEIRADVRRMLLGLTPRQRRPWCSSSSSGTRPTRRRASWACGPRPCEPSPPKDGRPCEPERSTPMPDVKELFETTTRDLHLEPGALQRQHRRQRRHRTVRTAAVVAVVAAVVAAAGILLTSAWSLGDQRLPAQPPPAPSQAHEPYMELIDASTGRVMGGDGWIGNVAPDSRAAISPDGSRVAFVRPVKASEQFPDQRPRVCQAAHGPWEEHRLRLRRIPAGVVARRAVDRVREHRPDGSTRHLRAERGHRRAPPRHAFPLVRGHPDLVPEMDGRSRSSAARTTRSPCGS